MKTLFKITEPKVVYNKYMSDLALGQMGQISSDGQAGLVGHGHFIVRDGVDHVVDLTWLHGGGWNNIKKNGLKIRILPAGSEITIIQK